MTIRKILVRPCSNCLRHYAVDVREESDIKNLGVLESILSLNAKRCFRCIGMR